jgi:2,3-bisphosphoglycerate-dependent phosphoglycerate mutase
MGKKVKLIMMRHGESLWNRNNIFTGWVDIPLSSKGIEEALEGGKKIANLPIDFVYVSSLMRAQMTAMLALSCHSSGKVPVMLHPENKKLEEWGKVYDPEAEKQCIPVFTAWQLNERMYGELQGKNKQRMREQYGDEQVKLWRRSFDVAPPNGESLAMTAERTLPFFKKDIVKHLEQGQNVFISAHGNSMRSIVMHLDNLSREEVLNLEIPTGEPLIYDYCDGKWEKEVS